MVKNLKAFPLRSITSQGYPQLLLLFNLVLEVVPTAFNQEGSFIFLSDLHFI